MRVINSCNVCVTGGAGFLGSHLVDHLIEDRNCQVLVIDNLVAGRREFVHKNAIFEHADITGSETYLKRLLKEHGIEYVFQYAAYPYIPVSFERPLHVFDVNAFGALKVINAAQEAGCAGILQVSSAEIYGGPIGIESDGGRAPFGNTRKITEEEFVIPHSTYGASKAAVDAMVSVRYKEAKTPVIALRQFNCIGERDFMHPYVVPEIIMQIHRKLERNKDREVPVLLGNNSFRDFLYAGDAVRMAVELLESGDFGCVYNSGSESGMQIYTLAELIGELMGTDVRVVPDISRVRPWEIWHLQSDNTKLYSAIHYRPQVNLEEALRRTIRSISDNGWRLGW